jgi:hypothetical protein
VRGSGDLKDPLNLNIPATAAQCPQSRRYCRTVTEILRLRLGT